MLSDFISVAESDAAASFLAFSPSLACACVERKQIPQYRLSELRRLRGLREGAGEELNNLGPRDWKTKVLQAGGNDPRGHLTTIVVPVRVLGYSPPAKSVLRQVCNALDERLSISNGRTEDWPGLYGFCAQGRSSGPVAPEQGARQPPRRKRLTAWPEIARILPSRAPGQTPSLREPLSSRSTRSSVWAPRQYRRQRPQGNPASASKPSSRRNQRPGELTSEAGRLPRRRCFAQAGARPLRRSRRDDSLRVRAPSRMAERIRRLDCRSRRRADRGRGGALAEEGSQRCPQGRSSRRGPAAYLHPQLRILQSCTRSITPEALPSASWRVDSFSDLGSRDPTTREFSSNNFRPDQLSETWKTIRHEGGMKRGQPSFGCLRVGMLLTERLQKSRGHGRDLGCFVCRGIKWNKI